MQTFVILGQSITRHQIIKSTVIVMRRTIRTLLPISGKGETATGASQDSANISRSRPGDALTFP